MRIEIREKPLYEVANAYGMNSMELLRIARDELKLSVKSHMSVLSASDHEALVKYLESKNKGSGSEKSAPARALTVRRRAAKPKKKQTAADKLAAEAAAAEPDSEPVLTSKTIVRRHTGEDKAPESSVFGTETAAGETPAPSSEVDATSEQALAATESAVPETAPAESPEKKSGGAVVVAQPDPEILKRTERERQERVREDKGAAGVPGAAHPDGRRVKHRDESGGEFGAKDGDSDVRKPSGLVQKTEVFHPVDYLKQEQVYRTKRKRVRTASSQRTQITTPSARKRVVQFFKPITVKELARKLSLKSSELIRKLDSMGMTGIGEDKVLDYDTCTLLAAEFKYEVENCVFTETLFFEKLDGAVADPKIEPRPPVVTIMGHVDHGKTTILDAIRKTQVAKGEAGGITQHIGAYYVTYQDKAITFIDTPGHEAFTAMRKRGADVTDIVVLVVAADDGVMPQTKEAISHAQAAGVSIVVAVNKMDVPGANIEKARNQLSEHKIVSEEWGGEHIFVPMSAIKGEGVETLFSAITLVAEMAELKAPMALHPSGVVIESRLDKSRGPIVTVIVTQGVFRVGGWMAAGLVKGKMRQMMDANGQAIKTGSPGMPVEIMGLESAPSAGSRLDILPKESDVQALIDYRREQAAKSDGEAADAAPPSIEELMSRVGETPETFRVNVILKTDVQGSEEAVKASLLALGDEQSEVNIVYSACGALSESDVDLAKTTESMLIAFNLPVTAAMRKIIEAAGIPCIETNIIYDLIERFQKVLRAGIKPEIVEEDLGEVEVRQIFRLTKGVIAGCYVKSGKVLRNVMAKVSRDGQIAGTGRIGSLKRFKEDVREVQTNYECGLTMEWKDGELQEGDVLLVYRQIEKMPAI